MALSTDANVTNLYSLSLYRENKLERLGWQVFFQTSQIFARKV
jgi:hypothetical protein